MQCKSKKESECPISYHLLKFNIMSHVKMSCCFLCLLISSVVIISDTDALPLISLPDMKDGILPWLLQRRQNGGGGGWLRPFRWLFPRKDDDDQDNGDQDVDSSDRQATSNIVSPYASLSQLAAQLISPSYAGSHLAPSTLSPYSPFESLGPGTFMTYGDELVYIPFASLREFNLDNAFVYPPGATPGGIATSTTPTPSPTSSPPVNNNDMWMSSSSNPWMSNK